MHWIDDVLDDLKFFCRQNGYKDLEASLEETQKIYRIEFKKRGNNQFSKSLKNEATAELPKGILIKLVHSKP